MIAALPLAVLALVRIDGPATCPAPAAVESALAALRPPAPSRSPAAADGARALRVTLFDEADALRVELRSADGASLGVRVLPRAGACADMAAAVAVVIAAGQADPGELPPAPIAVGESAPSPPAPPSLLLPPPPPPSARAQRAPSAVATGARARVGVESPAGARAPADVWLGAAALASFAGGRAAPGLALSGGLGRGRGEGSAAPPSGFGVGFGLHATTFRGEAGPGPGSTEWTRLVVGAGPQYRASTGAVALEAEARLVGGLVWVRGHGYSTDATSRRFALGFGAGIRESLRLGRLAPFVGVDADFWPGTDEISVTGVAGSRAIPALDVMIALGASFAPTRGGRPRPAEADARDIAIANSPAR